MRVRWTTDAADDLERICDYVDQDSAQSARRIAQSIVERTDSLKTFPHLGRPGRVAGTRELAHTPLPFVAIYQVIDNKNEVRVLRILHGARQWPPA